MTDFSRINGLFGGIQPLQGIGGAKQPAAPNKVQSVFDKSQAPDTFESTLGIGSLGGKPFDVAAHVAEVSNLSPEEAKAQLHSTTLFGISIL